MDSLKTMTNSMVVLLILTSVTWLLMIAVLTTVAGVVAPGDQDIFLGLRWILAYVLVGAIWLGLGGLLLVAGGQDVLPGWVRTAALILWPASAAAAFASLYLASDAVLRWPVLIPIAIPPLIAGYVAVLYQPSLAAVFGASAGSGVLWGVILALSLTIWPAVSRHLQEKLSRGVELGRAFAEREASEKEHRRSESLAKLNDMSPDAHLTQWYSLLDPENGVRDAAIAALKKVERRQGDVEEGLSYGIPAIMRLVPELDLNPTPQLCATAHTYLEKTAQAMRLQNREPYPYDDQAYIDGSFAGIRWFIAHGCNCDEGITAVEAAVRTYLDSPERQKVLGALAGLKQSH
jgi:hypothetical protein